MTAVNTDKPTLLDAIDAARAINLTLYHEIEALGAQLDTLLHEPDQKVQAAYDNIVKAYQTSGEALEQLETAYTAIVRANDNGYRSSVVLCRLETLKIAEVLSSDRTKV